MERNGRGIALRTLIAASWLIALVGLQPRVAHAVSTTATGLRVAFSAAGSCSVGSSSLAQDGSSSATVTLTGAGQCAITASQPGDSTYAPAANVVQSFMIARASTSVSLSSIADTPYHDPVTLAATVSPSSVGSQQLAGTVTFSIDGSPVGSSPVNGSGLALVSPTITQTVGSHAVTAAFTSTSTNFSDSVTASSTSFRVQPEDTTVSYLGDTAGDYHDSVLLKGKLLEDGDSTKPISGASLSFALGTRSCSGTTGTDGIASCSLMLNQDPGAVSSVSASFAGDSFYSSGGNSASFTGKKEETTTRYTGPTSFQVGSTPGLSAQLEEDGSVPISGKTLTITLGTGTTARSCTGTTGSDGTATCSLTAPLKTAGLLPLSASFAGDTDYLGSSDSSQSAIAFAFPLKGAFVIGNVTAANSLTKAVSFWGPQWGSKNSLSGGPAPSSFFGYARTLATIPPTCGGTWSTSPGASSLQPPVNTPAYMAVIVASRITQSGATISGDTIRIGIVRTGGGNVGAGSIGTGILMSTFCPVSSKQTADAIHTRRPSGPGGTALRLPPPAPARGHEDIPVHVRSVHHSFRYASRPVWHPNRHGRVLPVSRIARGYALTTSARVLSAQRRLHADVAGTKPQQIQFGALLDKTFGDPSFTVSATSVTQTTPPNPGGLPPDPSTVASPIDPTVTTTIGAATAFLYTGDNPIQTGVAPGTINPIRASVLKGRVLDGSGNALSGATVTVLGHPEFGQTLSRADGEYDLAVNGGSRLSVSISKKDYLPAQRDADAPWQDYTPVPDVALLPVDPNVSLIDLTSSAPIQVAQGSVETDADGSRQATLFFAQGTTASMILPGGGTQPITTLHVRATEYTVGANGAAQMPGSLPPTSGYTYATEFSVDEAQAADATRVSFSQPVISYLQNFLNYPVGMTIPSGSYDRATGHWMPENNGRIIKILSITNGMADLDLDGSGVPADAAALAALGISDAERAQLAATYAPGTTLWRTPLAHFSPCDFNWPYGPPDPSGPPPPGPDPGPSPGPYPPGPRPGPNPGPDPCPRQGSIIGCLAQSLGESIGITGTPFSLTYTSARSGNVKDYYRLTLPVSGPTFPGPVVSVLVEIAIAGRSFLARMAPSPSQNYTFVWDGKDAYGRLLQGSQPYTARVGYGYIPDVETPDSYDKAWARVWGTPSQFFGRQEVVLWQYAYSHGTLGVFHPLGQGLGGWTLDIQHEYDANAHTLYLGTGEQRNVDAQTYTGPALTLAAGGTNGCAPTAPCGDGGPAAQATFQGTLGTAVDASGAKYIADYQDSRIRRIDPDGTISTVAGSGVTCAVTTDPCGDGGSATQAQLNAPEGIAVAPDGTLYIADTLDSRIRRVSHGVITTVAGDGNLGFGGDGGPGTQAHLYYPTGVSVGPDGSLYIADASNQRIRRLMPDGTINTAAGVGSNCSYGANCFSGDNGPALKARLNYPFDVAAAPDGSIYIADQNNRRIRRVGPEGIITTFAGDGTRCFYGTNSTCGDGGPAAQASITPGPIALAPDGTLYAVDVDNSRLRVIRTSGYMQTAAGGAILGAASTSGPAGGADLYGLTGAAVSPDNTVFISRDRAALSIAPTLSGLGAGERVLPSSDGSEAYVFNVYGLHLRTLDALTGALRYQFLYDSRALVVGIVDGDGNTTTIERDGAGNPTAIVAPGGERTTLTLDANGYLASITDPAGDSNRFTTNANGALTSFTDPNGNLHTFQYDADGRLTQDQDPAGGSSTLVRTETGGGPKDFSVAVTSALGRTTTYAMEFLTNGDRRFTTTDPGGAQTVSIQAMDGTTTTKYPDGTTTMLQQGPDPRWGMLAPLITSVVQTTPGGHKKTITHTRTATLGQANDPLQVQTMHDVVQINGQQQYTADYSAADETLRSRTPQGHIVTLTLDGHGRISSISPAQYLDPIAETYDAHGNLTQVTQGSRSVTYTYDSQQRLASKQDPAGHTVLYGYDAADRPTSLTLPNGAIERQSYDANGNAISITMPSGAVHSLAATAVDQFAAYTPPGGGGSYSTSYGADGELRTVTLPSGRSEHYSYDGAGRPIDSVDQEGSAAYAYADSTNRLSSVTQTGPGTNQTVSMTYDGNLPVTTGMAGAVQGQYSYSYASDLLLSSVQLVSGNDTVTTALTRNRDSLLTGYGPFTFTRDDSDGLTLQIGDGSMALNLAYDSLGRTTSRGQTVNNIPEYGEQLTYNDSGLISQKVETIGGAAHTFTYTYDANGELTAVARDGTTVEQYAYDLNGNRTSRTLGTNPAESAIYDVQDRLTQQGATQYTINVDGYLAQRGADTFQYSTHGELLNATVRGAAVSYTYDGLGRRIARTDSGGTTQYFYGRPGNPMQVTDVRGPSGVLTTLYYDDSGLLYAMQRGSSRYYVATDQVGTPRVVSDSTGAVVKTLTYDSFGTLTGDSAPSFDLPIGFAGGLADPVTGLVHFGYRDYDPAAGRWTARDPGLYDSGQANLYVYSANSPIDVRDPTGLFCLGGSAYDGVGGGGEVCVTDKGLSVCAELGVGVGEELAVKPDGGLADDFVGANLEASAGISGVASATVGLSQNLVDPCNGTEATLNLNLAGANMDVLKGKGKNVLNLNQQKGDFPGVKGPLSKEGLNGLGKGALEGKAALKACSNVKW